MKLLHSNINKVEDKKINNKIWNDYCVLLKKYKIK